MKMNNIHIQYFFHIQRLQYLNEGLCLFFRVWWYVCRVVGLANFSVCMMIALWYEVGMLYADNLLLKYYLLLIVFILIDSQINLDYLVIFIVDLNRNWSSLSTKYSVGFSHGGLDVEGPDVLPAFLCQWNQEVDWHCDILSQILFGLVHISDTST